MQDYQRGRQPQYVANPNSQMYGAADQHARGGQMYQQNEPIGIDGNIPRQSRTGQRSPARKIQGVQRSASRGARSRSRGRMPSNGRQGSAHGRQGQQPGPVGHPEMNVLSPRVRQNAYPQYPEDGQQRTPGHRPNASQHHSFNYPGQSAQARAVDQTRERVFSQT